MNAVSDDGDRGELRRAARGRNALPPWVTNRLLVPQQHLLHGHDDHAEDAAAVEPSAAALPYCDRGLADIGVDRRW